MILIKTQWPIHKSLSMFNRLQLIRMATMLTFSKNMKKIMTSSVIVLESLSRLPLPIQTQKYKSTRFCPTMLFSSKKSNICKRKTINSKHLLTHKKPKWKYSKHKTNHSKLPSRKKTKLFCTKRKGSTNWVKNWSKWMNKKHSMPFMTKEFGKNKQKTRNFYGSCKRSRIWIKLSRKNWNKATKR